MKHAKNLLGYRAVVLLLTGALLSVASIRVTSQTGCPTNPTPFTDLGNMPSVFCQAVASVYFTGITSGTSATTYSPATNVTRDQMAAFLSRTHDSALRRGSRRAATGKWWTARIRPLTTFLYHGDDTQPHLVYCDGHSLWVTWLGSGTVSRHGLQGDFSQITRWTGAAGAWGILSDGHAAFITGFTNPGRLYQTVAGQPDVLQLPFFLPANPAGIACDGANLWTANFGTAPGTGSISYFNRSTFEQATYATGFSRPAGILFDGDNLWVTDQGDGVANAQLHRVNPATGTITLTLTLGVGAAYPVFDGTNLWVPNFLDSTISVVRATGALAGTVLTPTPLQGNGLNLPTAGAFDGERILFTNQGAADTSVSLWKAADLTALGNIVIPNNGHTARGACSDGINFYISTQGSGGRLLLRL